MELIMASEFTGFPMSSRMVTRDIRKRPESNAGSTTSHKIFVLEYEVKSLTNRIEFLEDMFEQLLKQSSQLNIKGVKVE